MYYTYTYAYRYMHIYMSICIHIHMHMWFSSETERCICAYLYISVFIHICIFVYIYTYAFTCAWSYVCLYLLRHVTLFPQDSFQLWHRVHVCKYVCVWCVCDCVWLCACVCVCAIVSTRKHACIQGSWKSTHVYMNICISVYMHYHPRIAFQFVQTLVWLDRVPLHPPPLLPRYICAQTGDVCGVDSSV